METTQKRGVLTQRIQEKAVEMLGRQIDMAELRLMPYIVSVMMDSQIIDPCKINQVERDILSKWKEEGLCEGGASGLRITEEFWYILMSVVYLGYVDLSV